MRPGRRSVYELFLNEFTQWVLRNKDLLKGRNYWFKSLALLWGKVSDKSLKKLAEMLNGYQIDGIKLEVCQVDGNYFVHFNPPGSREAGYWLLLPVLRTILEDMVSLVLQGRLVSNLFVGRPRLPFLTLNFDFDEIFNEEEKPKPAEICML